MNWNKPRKPARRAFTLVELLTVIVIIGILVSLVSVAVVAAVKRARQAKVTVEINGLDNALKLYKEKYGDFPPDNLADKAAVVAHLRLAFPRYGTGLTDAALYSRFTDDLSGLNLTASPDSATALVFWLGGPPVAGSTVWVPGGFSKDVENPFTPTSGTPRWDPFFDFDSARIAQQSGLLHFYPDVAGAKTRDCPYVYFRARNGGYQSAVPQLTSGTEESGVTPGVRPYKSAVTNQWANPRSFQIISAGLDNFYGGTTGAEPYYPTGTNNRGTGHFDNLTNFTEGRLEDAGT